MAWLVAVRSASPLETGFAEKLAFRKDSHHRLLAVLRQDSDLDLAFLDEKDRVGDIALCVDLLVFRVSLDGFSCPDQAQKSPGVERVLDLHFRHGVGPSRGREHNTLSHRKARGRGDAPVQSLYVGCATQMRRWDNLRLGRASPGTGPAGAASPGAFG
jgi:hypothetical protein